MKCDKSHTTIITIFSLATDSLGKTKEQDFPEKQYKDFYEFPDFSKH